LILVSTGSLESPASRDVKLLHSHRAITRDNHLQPQEQGLILDFSDWPEPEDGSGIRGAACYRGAVLAGVAPREREKTQS
jgi:hypothetical protein